MPKKIAFVDGRIHTPVGIREALVVEAGRIAAVGSASDLLLHAGNETEVVDLKGRSMFPGFGDSHMHFMSWAESQELMELRSCRSIMDLRKVLGDHIATNPAPASGWYRGRGWNQTRMADGRMPNRHDLDDLSPDIPVMLTRVCGHVAVLNTKALDIAGITRETRIEGGVIELGDDGEPSGLLSEDALGYVNARIPKLQDGDRLALLEKYAPVAASFGLTLLNSDDMGTFDFDFRRAMAFYLLAEREGKLPFRVRQQFLLPKRDLLLDFLSEGWRTGDGTPFYQIGPLKLLSDGSLGGATAFLRKDYADLPAGAAPEERRGVAIFQQEELNELVTLAHSSGMQVAIHAIGDGALEMCLDAFETAQTKSPGIARHMIVHAQIADDCQLDRMKALHLGAAIQPCFVPSDREMSIARLGREWTERSYRWKSMMRKGIALSAGSDAPVEDLRPLHGIHAAVTRLGPNDDPHMNWTPEERLSVAEAISLYTWDNAWHGGNEKRRGEILPGRDADLVVLEQDPFLTPTEGLWRIEVAMTLCAGRVTHRKSDIY